MLGAIVHDPVGLNEFGKKHAQVYLDAPGLCPRCLERYIDGREGGAKTPLIEEAVDGVKTGKWICPDGGRSYAQQILEDPQGLRGSSIIFPPTFPP
jgi:hypothetical protein